MRKNFLEFVNQYNQDIENKIKLNEAFREKDIDNVIDKIESILKKHIDGLISLVGFVDTIIDGEKCTSKQFIVLDKEDYTKTSFFQLNWINDNDSIDIYSIDFFKDLDVYWSGKGKADLSIYTLGTNIVKLLPVIWSIVNSKNYSLTEEDAKKLAQNTKVKESKYSIGKLNYILFNLDKNLIHESFIAKNKFSKSDLNNIENDYKNLYKLIKEGNDEDIKLAISKGKRVEISDSKEIRDAQGERKDPEQIFKEMNKYISLVIKGHQSALILCGAPGVGKTYRVKKQLKEAGYIEGQNLCTIKGKCTARRLYATLFGFKDQNDIILIDDADSLVGPQADENCINILKAALDSDTSPEGRLVTYGIAGKITDDDGEEIPKKCRIKSGVIVITNYRAGQLDTALRNRCFIQDIDFSNEEVLSIIKKLLPHIENQILTPKSKLKAFNYLNQLNEQGSKMELSLRTFVLCAKIFTACDDDPDFSDEDAKSMIEEQMKLQYARGGHKY